MARKPRNVEFMQTLKEISRHKTSSAFAKACGRSPANMSNYLSGRNTPGIRVLGSSIRHLFEWDVRPNKEIQKIEDLNTVSIEAGIYVIYDSGGQVLYLGKATNLRNELKQTLSRKIPSGLRLGPKLNKQRPKLKELAAYYSIFEVPSPRARHNMEAFLLRVFINQTHNTNIGSFR